jgi:molybdenum cofactor cytidylyltransferase
MKLYEAFEITPGDVVAIIGAGGKTSLLAALGYEMAEDGWRVLATTTMGMDEHLLELMPAVFSTASDRIEISRALSEQRFVFLYKSIKDGVVQGVPREELPLWLDTIDSDVWLVEADRANAALLKSPFEDEPGIPPDTTLIIPVASISALNHTLSDEQIYNPEAICARYGFASDTLIKAAWIAQVLRDEALGLKDVPENARLIAFLNQTPPKGYFRGRARLIAKLMMRSNRFHGIVLGAVRGIQPVVEVQRPVGAVILAAGLSSRMGSSKVLLPWSNGRTILEHIIEQLIRSRVDHITVVTGHQAKEIKALLRPLEVDVIYNRHYRSGEMLSSIKTGLAALPDHIAASMIVLGDQPRIQPKVIYQLLSRYAETSQNLLIPSFERRRGHPVLIGRRYWGEIQNLPEKATLRDFFNQHTDDIHYLEVDTDSVLGDVDTPQDYRDERWRAGFS